MAQYGFLVLLHKMYHWYLKARTLCINYNKKHFFKYIVQNISLTLNFDQETWFKVIAQLLPRSTLQQSNDMRLIGLQREKNNRIKIFHTAWQRLYTAKCATYISYMTSTVDLGTCFKFNAYPCSLSPFWMKLSQIGQGKRKIVSYKSRFVLDL